MESTTSYISPMQTGRIFYFPWDIYQIEGTNRFNISSARYTICNVKSQVFTPNNAPGPTRPGSEPRPAA